MEFSYLYRCLGVFFFSVFSVLGIVFGLVN